MQMLRRLDEACGAYCTPDSLLGRVSLVRTLRARVGPTCQDAGIGARELGAVVSPPSGKSIVKD
jgi:hypothetical protein